MAKLTVIDTYPAFLQFWGRARSETAERQIEGWAADYLAPWPELLAKQQADYASQGLDWRQIGRDRVFPLLETRRPAMAEARDNLLESGPALYEQARAALGFEADVSFVIYVGIGCGAGWATTYAGGPAVLFGLEAIAECGWSDAAAIGGLVAHELGHVAHRAWRGEPRWTEVGGPWWQLYTEGFAQRAEHAILGADTWHEAGRAEGGWLAWCRANRARLAAEFRRAAGAGEPVRHFFGSWHDIDGRTQTGYFLGHEAIRELEATMSLKEIAALEDPEQALRPIVARFANPERS